MTGPIHYSDVLPALDSIKRCPKCGTDVNPAAKRYMRLDEGVTRAGMVPGAMVRTCPCGFMWSERPLDAEGA